MRKAKRGYLQIGTLWKLVCWDIDFIEEVCAYYKASEEGTILEEKRVGMTYCEFPKELRC